MVYRVQMPVPLEISALFSGWEETMIWSCLQGVMGHVYALRGPDNKNENHVPLAALTQLGDFVCLAGQPSAELVQFQPENDRRPFRILVPRASEQAEWGKLIMQHYGPQATKVERYAIRKEPDVFDEAVLRRAVAAVPKQYVLSSITEPIYELCQQEEWSCDLVSQYPTWEDYQRNGLGVTAFFNGKLVAGASSYSSYHGGIEIEIDTKPDYRRQGLALACGAQLILRCRERQWYPSWDAQNKASAALAQKLGYHFSHAYVAYEIRENL